MRILHCVESYYPSVSGAPEVVRQLSEHMVKSGHDVTVATRKLPERGFKIHNGVKIVEFDIRPTGEHGMSTATGITGETKKYQDFLLKGDFDVIMSYAAQQWSTDLMLPILDKIKAVKVLVPCGYSGLYDPVFKKYFQKMPEYLKKFNATVYLAERYRDIDFARKHHIDNIHIIPNGADEHEFRKLPTPTQKKAFRKKNGIRGIMLMTLANYTGEKGHQELMYVFKRLPLPQVTLVSAGGITPGVGWYDQFEVQANRVNASRKFSGKKVIMIDGNKRAEIVELMKCSDMFVFLSNIEASPLVLFEAAAAGVPFIATNAGNSAEIARWTGAGVLVKTHQQPNGRVKADLGNTLLQITRLALNSRRRQKLGRRGRQAWLKKFTWQKLSQDYLDLYKELLEAKR